MKDHEIGQAIRDLHDIAIKYHGAQQMRSHIEEVVLRIRDSFRIKMLLTIEDDRKLRDDLIDVLRKNGFVYKKKVLPSRVCDDPRDEPLRPQRTGSSWPVLKLEDSSIL